MSQPQDPYAAGGGPGRPAHGVPSSVPTPPAAPGYSAPSAPPAPPASVGSAPGAASSAAPAPGAGASQLSPARAGATLGRLGIGNPLPTLVVGALAYVVALGAALVVIVSALLAVFAAGTGDVTGGADPTGGAAPSDGLGWRGVLGLLGIPAQLVSLASFGSYEMEVDLGFLGSMQMSARSMPLLITAAMVLTAFLGARLAQRRWGSSRVLGAVLWSGLSGFGAALFAVIVTRLTAFSLEEESMGLSLSMHSAGADMFFGTWALIGIPLLLGHLAGMEKPSWWPLVADLAAAPRLALVHALTYALPAGALLLLGGAIGMLLEGNGREVLALLLALPIWGLTALGMLAGMGMLVTPVHVNAQGRVEEFGVERMDEFFWFIDLPWYAWLPMVLLSLLVPLLVALLWHRDREIERGNVLAQVVSWAALPVAYFVGALVLLALVWSGMRAVVPMTGSLVLNAGLAAWTPLVAFFLGLWVEVLARFGAPFVDRFVPGLLVNWFRRSARARRASAAQAAGDGESNSAGYPPRASGYPPAPPAHPSAPSGPPAPPGA
ncbi:hypothetical protein [Brachybacterium saurashtrense]|uniref:Uncharacterized protein n=1 Tax=Brachybacterium saurashtrense TaxID=556288 RepID=A0A345YPP1_9MICO|nr:hypothetical protein [Brachybacterium saurashtrense]AXK45893.1 hypothetical protein DWV08_09910 [Brachybacterium saurashtrense]RRR24912.1 hypothetical protein DXU92_01655 [Brachybacterium saurashtrense]